MKQTVRTALYYSLWIIGFLAISYTIGLVTRDNMDWYQPLQKSALTPPDYMFPLVWSSLYILLAICGGRLFKNFPKNKDLVALFAAYMIVNWAWSFIFFGAHMITLGFAWIILSDLMLIAFAVMAWKRQRVLCYLVAPTIIWGCFAAYLNGAIMVLN